MSYLVTEALDLLLRFVQCFPASCVHVL